MSLRSRIERLRRTIPAQREDDPLDGYTLADGRPDWQRLRTLPGSDLMRRYLRAIRQSRGPERRTAADRAEQDRLRALPADAFEREYAAALGGPAR